jgi:RNA polymerase-binding transcription factor
MTEDTRAALLAAQTSTAARLAALERDFVSSVAAADTANTDDEHDPEGATIAFERQHVAALIATAREQLRELSDALTRLDDGRYGSCVRCGAPIGRERLVARPAASLCIECASRAGRGR